MEAPEKLYLHPTVKGKVGAIWLTNEDVEYTRTDAFIKKACDYLNNFYNEETRSYLIAEDIEKFINYMKGE